MLETSVGEHKRFAKIASISLTPCLIIIILFTLARPILVGVQRQIIGTAIVGFNTPSDEVKDGSDNV